MRKILFNFGVRNVSIYMHNGIMHIFFSEKRDDKGIADCLGIPICINGVYYNCITNQKTPP